MKPHLTTILLLLLVGVLVNVAVAWTCAYLVPFGSFTAKQYEVGSGQYWSVLSWEAFGSRRIVSVRPVSDTVDLDPLGDRRPALPAWCRIGKGDRPPSGTTVVLEAAEAHGWPFLSLSTAFAAGSPPPSFHARGALEGVEIEPPSDATNVYDASGRNLPLRPVWWGFVANTILCAAIAWGLSRLPFAVRRLTRARRGLCPACGYPPGGSAICPECGAPRQTSSGTRQQEAD